MPIIESDDDYSENQIKKQSRNFITFSDEQTLKELFPSNKLKVNQHKLCAVTGLPAKYFDPITQCPYANLYAFKVLREKHANRKKSAS